MKITIIPSDGIVGVDRVFRKVSMTEFDPTVFHAVQFSTNSNSGHVEYEDGRPNEPITNISLFQVLLDRWTAAAPAPLPSLTPEQIAEQQRRTQYSSTIASDTVISTIKIMTVAEFDAWWDANVTTAAQAIGILKRLVKLIIFKLL